MGRQLAIQLAELGAKVIATDINLENAFHTAQMCEIHSGQCEAIQLDVTDHEQFAAVLQDVKTRYGRIGYLFNNAGIAMFGELMDMTREQWQHIVDVNIWGVINGTTLGYELMRKQGFGHIINTASAAGLGPVPLLSAYAMTKHAVVGLSTSLREEARAFGIKVSVVCPGIVNTNIFDASTGFSVPIDEVRPKSPIPEMDAAEAATEILNGVRKNQNKIVFPTSAKLMDYSQRLNPSLTTPVHQLVLKQFRKLQDELYDTEN